MKMKKNTNRQKQASLPIKADILFEGKRDMELDIDRMVNEGLGGGYVEPHSNGTVDNSTPEEQAKE